jgi:hypothetical protein
MVEILLRERFMSTQLRDMKTTLALHTDQTLVERKLKKLKSYIYSVPYYNSYSGRIIGVDMFFDKTARNTLRKLVESSQLPLF